MQDEFFSYGSLEDRVPADHPLRPICLMVDAALKEMSARFDEIYGEGGRRSIPPERLLRGKRPVNPGEHRLVRARSD